jgi:hypothetical protein
LPVGHPGIFSDDPHIAQEVPCQPAQRTSPQSHAQGIRTAPTAPFLFGAALVLAAALLMCFWMPWDAVAEASPRG